MHKTDRFAPARTESVQVRLSDEHSDWTFLEFQPALARLSHAGTRAVLRYAEAALTANHRPSPEPESAFATIQADGFGQIF